MANFSKKVFIVKSFSSPYRKKGGVSANRVNQAIVANQVRLIDEDSQQLGVLARDEALKMARDKGLDLIEIAGKASPPVCKIMDYGKFKYQINKKLHEAKKNQKQIQTKEIKLRPKTEEHDFDFKYRRALQFLKDGNKVKVIVVFRGREMAYKEFGHRLLQRFIKQLNEISKVEQQTKNDARMISVILAPQKTSVSVVEQ